MKKRIEFLLLFVPLMLLILLPAVLFFATKGNNGFIGPLQYLRLFLNDSTFWKALFNTYSLAFILSVAIVLVLAFLRRFMEFLKKRRWFYGMSLALGSVASFFAIWIQRILMNHANGITATLLPTVYEIIMGMQVGFLTVLVFWLIELFVRGRIRSSREPSAYSSTIG